MLCIGRKLSSLLIVVGASLLLVLSFGYGVGVGARHWPPYSAIKKASDFVQGGASDASRIAEAAARIAALAGSHAEASMPAQAQFAREFVFYHSIHQIDSEHARYAWDVSTVLDMLYRHYLTGRDPPHLSCGPRAIALKAVLDAMGTESRLVHVFTSDYDEIRSHTLLEAYDVDSARWVIEDPGYDVSYVDTATGEPVPLLGLVLGNAQSVVPVSRRGRGWKSNDVDCLLAHYFQAAKYDSSDAAVDVIFVNTDRFSVTKRFPANDNMTFAEFSRKNYRRPVFVLSDAGRLPLPGSLLLGALHNGAKAQGVPSFTVTGSTMPEKLSGRQRLFPQSPHSPTPALSRTRSHLSLPIAWTREMRDGSYFPVTVAARERLLTATAASLRHGISQPKKTPLTR